MEERNNLIQWIKEHRKELIIAGISVGTLILIILGIRNRTEIKAVWDSLRRTVKTPETNRVGEVESIIEDISIAPVQEVVSSVTPNTEPISFEVCRHIRNLPEGWHASHEKIAEAMKYDISLMEGQTWVDSYVKGGAA